MRECGVVKGESVKIFRMKLVVVAMLMSLYSDALLGMEKVGVDSLKESAENIPKFKGEIKITSPVENKKKSQMALKGMVLSDPEIKNLIVITDTTGVELKHGDIGPNFKDFSQALNAHEPVMVTDHIVGDFARQIQADYIPTPKEDLDTPALRKGFEEIRANKEITNFYEKNWKIYRIVIEEKHAKDKTILEEKAWPQSKTSNKMSRFFLFVPFNTASTYTEEEVDKIFVAPKFIEYKFDPKKFEYSDLENEAKKSIRPDETTRNAWIYSENSAAALEELIKAVIPLGYSWSIFAKGHGTAWGRIAGMPIEMFQRFIGVINKYSKKRVDEGCFNVNIFFARSCHIAGEISKQIYAPVKEGDLVPQDFNFPIVLGGSDDTSCYSSFDFDYKEFFNYANKINKSREDFKKFLLYCADYSSPHKKNIHKQANVPQVMLAHGVKFDAYSIDNVVRTIGNVEYVAKKMSAGDAVFFVDNARVMMVAPTYFDAILKVWPYKIPIVASKEMLGKKPYKDDFEACKKITSTLWKNFVFTDYELALDNGDLDSLGVENKDAFVKRISLYFPAFIPLNKRVKNFFFKHIIVEDPGYGELGDFLKELDSKGLARFGVFKFIRDSFLYSYGDIDRTIYIEKLEGANDLYTMLDKQHSLAKARLGFLSEDTKALLKSLKSQKGKTICLNDVIVELGDEVNTFSVTFKYDHTHWEYKCSPSDEGKNPSIVPIKYEFLEFAKKGRNPSFFKKEKASISDMSVRTVQAHFSRVSQFRTENDYKDFDGLKKQFDKDVFAISSEWLDNVIGNIGSIQLRGFLMKKDFLESAMDIFSQIVEGDKIDTKTFFEFVKKYVEFLKNNLEENDIESKKVLEFFELAVDNFLEESNTFSMSYKALLEFYKVKVDEAFQKTLKKWKIRSLETAQKIREKADAIANKIQSRSFDVIFRANMLKRLAFKAGFSLYDYDEHAEEFTEKIKKILTKKCEWALASVKATEKVEEFEQVDKNEKNYVFNSLMQLVKKSFPKEERRPVVHFVFVDSFVGVNDLPIICAADQIKKWGIVRVVLGPKMNKEDIEKLKNDIGYLHPILKNTMVTGDFITLKNILITITENKKQEVNFSISAMLGDSSKMINYYSSLQKLSENCTQKKKVGKTLVEYASYDDFKKTNKDFFNKNSLFDVPAGEVAFGAYKKIITKIRDKY